MTDADIAFIDAKIASLMKDLASLRESLVQLDILIQRRKKGDERQMPPWLQGEPPNQSLVWPPPSVQTHGVG